MIFETFEAGLTTPIPYKMSDEEKATMKPSDYKFIFSKDFIVFPDKLVRLQKTHLKDEYTINRVPFKNYSKYVSIVKLPAKHEHRTKYSRFQLEFENGDKFNLIMDKWNIMKMNFIKDRYWLFNDGKWLATFLVSIAAIIISLIALSNKCK